jgi:hypothetical protein
MHFEKQKLKIFILLFISFFAVATPYLASARGLFVPCGGYTDAAGTQRENPCTFLDIFTLIAKVTNFLVAMAGVYAAYKIIEAGFWLIISMGNEETITKYRSGILDAIIGLGLVLMAYMLINTVVNVLLTRDLVTTTNPKCVLDLRSPQTYLTINQNPCSSLPESTLHVSP